MNPKINELENERNKKKMPNDTFFFKFISIKLTTIRLIQLLSEVKNRLKRKSESCNKKYVSYESPIFGAIYLIKIIVILRVY